MKIIITKEQYRLLVFSLLETLVGKLSIKTIKDKWEENNDKHDYHTLYDESGEEIANIWVKGGLRNKGCKKDLTLDESFSQSLENYIPYYKHHIFSEVLIEYVYKYTKIKCDCIQYDYDYKHRVEKTDDGEEYEYTNAKTRKYNVKKKKKIKESVDGKSSLENLIYEFLNDDFDPDYNWGPELFDFYREDVKQHGVIPFYIMGSEAYVYYEDGTLEIMPWVCEKLNEYFNDLWYSVFKSWFEENSGLKVSMMVDSRNDNRLLEESIDNSNAIEQIMDFENINLKFLYTGDRVLDDDELEDYFGSNVIDDDEIEDTLDGGADIFKRKIWLKFYFNNILSTILDIEFITKNNKVMGMSSCSNFKDVTDTFKYVPDDVLVPYFIEKGKDYLEGVLSDGNNLNESVEDKNPIEKILNMDGIEVSINYGSRVYDDIWGKPYDSVYFWFDSPNFPRKIYKTIWYNTKNNKVIGVDIIPNFKTISDSFEFVPVEILNSYFIEMGKEFLENILPSKHPILQQ